jgi:protein gp37
MGQSKIEWTDMVWNVCTGCTKVSPGCANCYAERYAARGIGDFKQSFCGGTMIARSFSEVRMHPERLERPLHWRKPKKIFVCSVGDLFHEDISDEFIDQVFKTMARAPQHTFQILTKRPGRMQSIVPIIRGHYPDRLNHVWLGVSCENQAAADERIPLLIETPAAIKFVSCEPLLGPIDFRKVPKFNTVDFDLSNWWAIVGGESGPHARPCRIEWIEKIIALCETADVPLFVKQLGAYPIWAGAKSEPIEPARGKNADPSEWPESLRVREFPINAM